MIHLPLLLTLLYISKKEKSEKIENLASEEITKVYILSDAMKEKQFYSGFTSHTDKTGSYKGHQACNCYGVGLVALENVSKDHSLNLKGMISCIKNIAGIVKVRNVKEEHHLQK